MDIETQIKGRTGRDFETNSVPKTGTEPVCGCGFKLLHLLAKRPDVRVGALGVQFFTIPVAGSNLFSTFQLRLFMHSNITGPFRECQYLYVHWFRLFLPSPWGKGRGWGQMWGSGSL